MDDSQAFPNRISKTQLAIATAIVLIAFLLRLIVLVERAGADYQFLPERGTDPYTYLNNARGVLDGTFPTSPYWHHPGPAYFYAFLMLLIGDSVPLILIVQALVDSLTVGWLIGTGWLITRREWGGYVAGIIYGVYPIAIFYGTTGIIAPQANMLLTLILFLSFWQREKMRWWRTILLGVLCGFLAVERFNLLPIAGLVWLWMLAQTVDWKQKLFHATAFAILTFATIAPITWMNYRTSGGDFIPVTRIGSLELYRANNRESAGRNDQTLATINIDSEPQVALIRDIRIAPYRFAGLIAYKFALFWSHFETSNNLTYYDGLDASRVLQLLPINFWWLASGGLLGLALLWRQDKRATLFLGTLLWWICMSYLIVFAYGRLRHPASIPLALLTGVAVVSIVDNIRYRIAAKQLAFTYGVPTLLIVLLLGFSQWVLYPNPKLPPNRMYQTLPSDAVRLDAQFGDITLVGWRPIDAWTASTDGWVPVFEAYTVELFWQINQETDISYNFFLAYVDNGERYEAVDQPIGAVAFPYFTTDQWTDNRILGEIVTLRLDDNVPQGRSGQIRAGVWYWDAEGLIVNVPLANGDPNILLQTLAVFNNLREPDVPELPQSNLVFGDLIALRGYDIPTNALTGETVTLRFQWEALQNITGNYRLFLHVVDENREIVTQGDNLPIIDLITSNWLPNYALYSELPLTMPAQSGTYDIYAGLYDETGRLTIDAPDNRVLLGTITVE